MASSSAVKLDDLTALSGASSSSATPTANANAQAPSNSSIDEHLFYPSLDDKDPISERSKSPPEEQPRQLLKDRLYVGNLHPTVDEYTLLQIFSKFGKVTKMDFLFHKSGALKGKPRGYAFIEYGNPDDARKALTMAHEKPLRGRKLVVTFAHQAPLDQYGSGSGIALPSSLKNRKTMNDAGRPTALSLMKTGMSHRGEGKTTDKIAMMEAKLRQMERTNPVPKSTAPLVTHGQDVQMDDAAVVANRPSPPATSSLPYHPSLPMKPPPPLPKHLASTLDLSSSQNSKHGASKTANSLPSLTMLQSAAKAKVNPLLEAKLLGLQPTLQSGANAHPRTSKTTKLTGVKIKAKEKSQP
ncbi:putative RNA-binding protein 18 [Psilocybe cubensis]|uniref:RNA-binding protein 18 n=2 Tax=Psilocybe cubensis TaxID=181762 RepID=A0ACB8GKC4_PSICU|nr:putative RNA-binding protein 18 [Psilocybe cubensis]KAH9475949.1 putative RNA-binding protein 18 [Psilocybe cubensis]